MELVKFKCLNCGKCCKVFKPEDIKADGKKIVLNKPGLILQDWEHNLINEELANIKSNRKILYHTAYYDNLNKETIINTYSLDQGDCPFLIENKCSIYDKRPSVCRRFPFLFDIIGILFSKNPYMPRNVLCSFEKEDHFLDNVNGKRMEILKMLEERYGEIFYYQLGYLFFQKEINNFLKEMEEKGIILLGEKIKNSKKIGLSELYERITGKNIKDFFNIDSITSLYRSMDLAQIAKKSLI